LLRLEHLAVRAKHRRDAAVLHRRHEFQCAAEDVERAIELTSFRVGRRQNIEGNGIMSCARRNRAVGEFDRARAVAGAGIG